MGFNQEARTISRLFFLVSWFPDLVFFSCVPTFIREAPASLSAASRLCRASRSSHSLDSSFVFVGSLQIFEHLSQSVTDLSSCPVYELFHSNFQRPDRCGGLVFWTQAVLAVRGRDRLCRRSGARAASGPGTSSRAQSLRHFSCTIHSTRQLSL